MYKNIVIAVDLSKEYSWQHISSVAFNLATAFKSQLHFVNIVPGIGVSIIEDYLPVEWMNNQIDQNSKKIENLIDVYIPSEIKVKTYVGQGIISDEIIKYVNAVESDLILLPAIWPDMEENIIGPNGLKIIKSSTVSVFIVRG